MRRTHTGAVETGTNAGSDFAAPGIARLLSFSAAPVFALMALWTGVFSGPADMLCLSMHGASALSGMATMYLLMSVFHLAPWLRLVRRW